MHPTRKVFTASYRSLSKYITGYDTALFVHNIAEEHAFVEITPRFHEWVAMKEGYYNTTMGWNSIITEVTQSDEEGLDLFFKYYDEYVLRKASILFEYVVSEKDVSTLNHFSRHTYDERKHYIDGRVQIISYDTTKRGVFKRWISQKGEHLGYQYSLYSSYERALEVLHELLAWH